MKSKKFVLAGLVLLAIVMVLVGCDTNAGTVQHEHTGGTATCISKAKCSECGAEYGEYNGNNHEQEEVADSTHIKKHLCCESVEIDGTLGGKTEATEEEVDALVEQLKAYVDNGIITIIVPGSQPATIDMGLWINTAIGEAIYRLSKEESYDGKIDLILPDVTEIVDQEFDGAHALNSINLPKVTTVGDGAFYGCQYLEELTFGSVVTAINHNTRAEFHRVGEKVEGCDLVLNCGQAGENSPYIPDFTANTWYDANNKFKSITLTHTGECDECKANQ